jgi:ABC-type branched-subunit amino acid transport system substrate-binding protein/DNA-binding SARP family transcriptional activator
MQDPVRTLARLAGAGQPAQSMPADAFESRSTIRVMQFRILGPLEVTDGGRDLALGGPRQRLVLASLILEANHVVPTDRLIDRIWGEEHPDSARGALFSYISRLRKLLGADRIQARPPGYILLAEGNEVDALRFAALVSEASARNDDREATRAILTQALELWRGDALSDLAEFDELRPAIARLEELRLGALEDRIEADIDLGRHRESVATLESLTTEYPLRERLWSQLILALYRSGRQGDALGAFHRARNTLVEELGIDPTPEVRRLHEMVLRQDPALDLRPMREYVVVPEQAVATTDAAPRGPARIEPGIAVVGAAPPRKRLLPIGGAAVTLLLSGIAAWLFAFGPRSGLPAVDWRIGLDMPLSGSGAGLGKPVRDAVQLAIDDLNAAGGVDGLTVELIALDNARDPERAVQNARTLIADPTTVAMIGPWGSGPAQAVIPITNEAGLLQCSPSSTLPGLTKPRHGALDLRAARPDEINFVRLAPSDDVQAVAMASFAYRDLVARHALVVDDTGVGRDIADAFEDQFTELGGSSIRRALNPDADPQSVLAPLADQVIRPGLVFFGGEPETGAELRRAMAGAGYASTPLLSWDFLLDGAGSDQGSFLQRVGVDGAVGSYVAHASLPDHKSSFADAYRDRFGVEADEYAAAGYACVEIITAAMRGVADRAPAVGDTRELVRAFGVDPANRYETILGTVGFDANGDARQQFVTFYRVEASAAGGTGDWVVFKKQDFGPAR